MSNGLKTEHRITDFLWSMLLGVLPVVVACFAIANSPLLWMLGYLVVMLLLGVAEVGCLCRHCPYYRQQPGITVHCRFMWGPTKWFKPKPGALSSLDKAILYSFFVLAFSFPLYWLIQQPALLVIYLWAIGIMVWTLGRYECTQCIHFGCPFNAAAKADQSAHVAEDGREHFPVKLRGELSGRDESNAEFPGL